MSTSLVKFQIGPVQDFIAQARSTRDLWSGSYLLSWLMAAGIAKLPKCGEELIFPGADNQPLIVFHKDRIKPKNLKALLTPNLPNLFVARVPYEQAKAVANSVESAIKTEWGNIVDSVWNNHISLNIKEEKKSRFYAQVERLLSIAWQITPETGDYQKDYRMNGWQLDAVRQTRNFQSWGGGQWTIGHEKDSLTGKEEAIAGGKTGDKNYADKVSEEFKHLFKHNDHLGAATLIKRVWHLTYLWPKLWPKDEKVRKINSTEFPIPSTRGIAMHEPESDGDPEDVEAAPGEKYFAVLALDGDQIGKWISGEFTNCLEPKLEAHHKKFSQCLGEFALQQARNVVEKRQGHLIYAGGDDVLALLPADTALDCAKALRVAFREATAAIKGKDEKGNEKRPDCSVGIAIAHFKSPLQDVVREAQEAEKRAKREPQQGGFGRSAVAITLMKRSGEISQWGCQWDSGGNKLDKDIDKFSGGIELYRQIEKLLDDGVVSARFPHRVCQLLEPYRNSNKGLCELKDVVGFNSLEIIKSEFNHASERQGSKQVVQQLEKPLDDYLKTISGIQKQLNDIIGLCTTVAFVNRNKNPKTT
jgi:CRISPR-associated protein Cmr2